MKKKIKNYQVGLDSEVFAVSLVTSPAIEEDFVYFNKDEKKVEMFANEEKHLLYGAALIPGKKIYRYDENTDTEYYLTFSAEAIEKLSQEFLKEYRQKNVTLQHEDEAPEITVVESWLKSSMDYDKSIALGLSKDLPVNTWFLGMKCNNIDAWERVRSGELRGFSVESLISLEDFSKIEDNDENNDMKMTSEEMFERIKQLIMSLFNKEEEDFEAEPAPAEPTPVEPTPAPEPEPTPVEPQPVEPEPQPEPTPEPKPEPQPEPVEKAYEQEVAELNATLEALKTEIAALKSLNEGMQHKIDDLNKQPSAKPINPLGGNGNQVDSYSAWREQMSKML